MKGLLYTERTLNTKSESRELESRTRFLLENLNLAWFMALYLLHIKMGGCEFRLAFDCGLKLGLFTLLGRSATDASLVLYFHLMVGGMATKQVYGSWIRSKQNQNKYTKTIRYTTTLLKFTLTFSETTMKHRLLLQRSLLFISILTSSTELAVKTSTPFPWM